MFLYSSFFISHFSFLISSKRLTILVLVLVFEHGQITLVSAGGNEVIFHRLDDSTTRFVGMRTVGKTTVLGEMEDFLEITGQFFFLDIKRTEALDARSIYQITTLRQFNHLTECGGVHTRIVRIADFCSTLGSMRNQAVDER